MKVDSKIHKLVSVPNWHHLTNKGLTVIVDVSPSLCGVRFNSQSQGNSGMRPHFSTLSLFGLSKPLTFFISSRCGELVLERGCYAL